MDRVHFFPKYFNEAFLPQLHPDGKRWSWTAYETGAQDSLRIKWSFYQNMSIDGDGGLAKFGYFRPSERRQKLPNKYADLYGTPFKRIMLTLLREQLQYKELLWKCELNPNALEEVLCDVMSFDPPAIRKQNGKYVLTIPIFTSDDLKYILNNTDRVAGHIHNEVVIPAREECMKAALDVGLRFPLPGWGTLPRDIALQHLVDDGIITGVPDPPVKWNWCVWGWEGKLLLWEEVSTSQMKESSSIQISIRLYFTEPKPSFSRALTWM